VNTNSPLDAKEYKNKARRQGIAGFRNQPKNEKSDMYAAECLEVSLPYFFGFSTNFKNRKQFRFKVRHCNTNKGDVHPPAQSDRQSITHRKRAISSNITIHDITKRFTKPITITSFIKGYTRGIYSA